MTSKNFEARISTEWITCALGAGNWITVITERSTWSHFDGLMTKLLLITFYDFLIRHFKKNVKSHVFLKSEKNVKYVFSNTGPNLTKDVIWGPPNYALMSVCLLSMRVQDLSLDNVFVFSWNALGWFTGFCFWRKNRYCWRRPAWGTCFGIIIEE